ncbi:MAG: DUF1540 domain-containing protein [Clostridia bacterium]|nr:DUF1540 domain-containing protein [Clostridia bacterium]
MQNNINDGVKCGVKSCKYNDNGHICVLDKILVTSDINDKHYCKSFEEKSNMQEF